MKLDQTRFDEDLPKLLAAIERLGRLLEHMRREGEHRLDPPLRDRRAVVIDDKRAFVESWKKSVAYAIQTKDYQGWELRNVLADMRAISRVMDLDTSGSAPEPGFSAATTANFELAKPLDNVLRGL